MRKMFSLKQLQEIAKSTIENANSLELQSVNAKKITGDSIIENMNGYSAELRTPSNITLENVYQGVVKTGNKITFVCAIKITRTGTIASDVDLVRFTIPSKIGANLYPVTLGTYPNGLAFQNISVMDSYKSGSSQYALLEKSNNTSLTFYICNPTSINNLTLNTEYYFRMECTFLLSNNLIS